MLWAHARPDVFNHNLETVLLVFIRQFVQGLVITPRFVFWSGLRKLDSGIYTKSGLMVGLGESLEEVGQVMDDLRAAQVDFLTVGQHLQPSPKHAPVDRFWTPEEFQNLEKWRKPKAF